MIFQKKHHQIHLTINGGKNLKEISFILIIICLLATYAYAIEYPQLIEHISKKLDCNEEQADDFMHYVDNFVTEVQNIFTNIASHRVADSQKQDLINRTIQKHFKNPTSSIQVSSLNYNRIKTYPVNQYLDHLANLSKKKYIKVKLYYKPDYLSMGKIYSYQDPVYGHSYEFQIAVWQIFEGRCVDNRPLYIDATQKDFILMFHKKKHSKYWTLKIKAIAVKETVSLDEFKQKWR